MRSIFPGMDPFIEMSEWEDFHTRFIVAISDFLVPQLRAEYAIRVEKRVYFEHSAEEGRLARPDLIVTNQSEGVSSATSVASSGAAIIEPIEMTIPLMKVEEKHLYIRRIDNAEVITIIELLSPSNKRKGSDGRREYLAKRDDILKTNVNLVELDFLRGGERLPVLGPLPKGDYYAFVCRAARRTKVDVYPWPLNHSLPTIPIPLEPDVRELTLDLQAAFDHVFEKARYGTSDFYGVTLTPSVGAADAAWIERLLGESGVG